MPRFPTWINRQFVLLLALWLGWGAAYLFGFRSQWQQYKQARESVAPLTQQIESYSAAVKQIPNAAQRTGDLEERLRKLTAQRLGPETTALAIQHLARLAQESQVSIESIGPGEESDAKGRAALPPEVDRRTVLVRFRCAYQPLGNFLEGLGKLPLPVAVDRLSIRSSPAGPEADLRVELLLETYGLMK